MFFLTILLLQYDTESLNGAIPAENVLTFTFTEVLLDNKTAVLAKGHDAVCLFVNDTCDTPVLETLHELGVVCCPITTLNSTVSLKS